MKATQTTPTTCPFLKQVVMLYCDACPMKKMVPLDQLVSGGPCLAESYADCSLYQDVVKRLGTGPEAFDAELPEEADGSGREVSP